MSNRLKATEVFIALSEKVGMLPTREVIAVWMGLKSARVGAQESRLLLLEEAVTQLGLTSVRSTCKYKGKRDIGKGGWSNKFGGSFPIDTPEGDWLLYIAPTEEIALRAREAEEDGREFDFGSELGIPECCARFYVDNQNIAMAKQNDYVPLVLRNSREEAPYEPLLNYVAQYFGYSLISFFPCSFNCEHAKHVAQRSYDALATVAPKLAAETLRFQRMSILYTEYRGLYAFEGATYDPTTRLLTYDQQRIHGTLPATSSVFRQLLLGNRLEVLSKNHVRVLNGERQMADIEGENVSACIF